MLRHFSVLIFIEIFVAAPLAFWLMWQFAFKGRAAYYTGNALILLTFGLPIVVVSIIYARSRKTNAQNK